MNATIHRILDAATGFLAALGALIAIPQYQPLGIPADAGLALVFASAVVGLFAVAWRQVSDPTP